MSDIRDIRFSPATPAQVDDGLLGFVRFECGPLRLDGVQLRRSRDAKLGLSFATRTSANGIEYPLIRPITTWERERITNAVVAELRRRGELP